VLVHNDSVPGRINFTFRSRTKEISKVADERVFIFIIMIIDILSIMKDLQANSVGPNQSQQVPVSVQAVSNLSFFLLEGWIVLKASDKTLV
jgi:hypothetical protein